MAPKPPAASRWSGKDAQIATVPTRRLIWRSYGPQKSGKTHFALTSPGPIFIQSFDIGLEGVVEQFLDAGKDVRRIEYPFNAENYTSEAKCQEEADKVWKLFLADYESALKEARTVVWDTETEVWELLRYARFGAMSDRPANYKALNDEYRGLVRKAYGGGVNLGLIQKVKEKWISKFDPQKSKMVAHNTGEMEPTGMKEIGFLVQVNLRHERVMDDAMNVSYAVNIEDVRHTAGQYLVGNTIGSLDFPTLAQGIFPDSEEGDWK